jgi:2-polyprenyl-3-methyl-5-hydroxy-6-metoxy-1,4-benzoquinol methylase
MLQTPSPLVRVSGTTEPAPGDHDRPSRTTCPGCGSRRWRPAFHVREFRFRRCRQCRTLFVDRPPPEKELASIYADGAYFANPDYPSREYRGYQDYLAERPHVEDKFGLVLDHIERQVAPGRLLDVGAGPGLLVALARTRGWEARGLDLNPWAVTYARENLNVNIEHRSLEDAALKERSLDAVTMLDLIEHVPDPGALLAETARVTRPGGVLSILTPDAGSPTTRFLGRRWPEVQRAGEHITLFSVRGLAELVRSHSFEPCGWHSIGKVASIETLVSDLAPLAGRVNRSLRRAVAGTKIGSWTIDLDPRAKFCLYATRVGDAEGLYPNAPRHSRPPRIPKRIGT